MSVRTLMDEFEYFKAHQDELVDKYKGKFVVIKNAEVLGAYDDLANAIHVTAKSHQMGTFLVQKCEAGPECYTVTYCTPGLAAA